MTYHYNHRPWRNVKLSQKERVRLYLLAGYPLTPLEALNKFGTMRLSAIIHTLRHEESMNIIDLNKEGGDNYSNYCLATQVDDNGQISMV